MSATIESLELKITSNSKSAASGIDALAQSLGKLRDATKGGSGLGSVAKQVGAIGTAVSGINSQAVSNLVGMVNAIKSLSGVKVSSNIATQLSGIASALNSLNVSGKGAAKIRELVTALQPLTKMPKQNLSSYVTAIKNIQKAMAELDKVDFGAFKAKILEVVEAVQPLATEMSKIAAGFSVLPTKISKVSSSTDKLSSSNNNASLSFMAMTSKIRMVSNTIRTVGKTLMNFVKTSSDYIENVNLFTVSMGQYVDEAKAYAETVSEIMGIDPGEWMRDQGVFQTLITGFGVAGDKAAIMSKNLTQLGYDLSSFYNIETGGDKGSMNKLQSAIAGELEPLRRLGYDLSQAKLEATALELGIDKSVSSMTQAEKSMLRYHAIMTQVTTVHGDMARTLDAPANQMRILKAQFEMLTRSVGNIFIPIINKLLPYLVAVTKVLREMMSSIATLAGFSMPEVDYSGVEAVSSVAEDTGAAMDEATESAKKLKSYMLGFDELNVINPNEGSSSSGDDLASAFDIELPEYDFLGEATGQRVDGIVAKINEVLEPIGELIDKTAEWAKMLDFEPIKEGFDGLGTSIETALAFIGEVSGFLYEDILLPISKWAIENGLPAAFEAIAEALDTVKTFLTPVLKGIEKVKPVFEPIVAWIGDVLVAVFEGLRDIFAKVGDVFEKKGGAIEGIIIGLGEIIDALWSFLKPLIDEIIPLIERTFSTVGDTVAGVVEGVIDIVKGLVDFVAGIFTGDWARAGDGFVNIFKGIWDTIVSILEGAWNIVTSVLGAVWDGIIGVFTPVATWINENVIQPVVNFFKGLWETVAGFFVGLGEDIKNIWNSIPTWVDEKVVQPVVKFFTGLWNDIKSVWSTVAKWFDKKVIQPIVKFFEPIVEWISTFFQGCWLIIKATWVVASTWFNENVIIPVVDFFKGLWESVAGFFSSLWEGIVTTWTNVSTWFNENVIIPVVDFFKGVWTSVSGFFESLWEDIVTTWTNVSTWFNENVVVPVVDFFKGVWTSVSGFFSSLWEDIKKVWEAIPTWFSETIIEPVKEAFEKACEKIGEFFSDLWLGIRQGVANAMNGVIGSIETAINWLIKGINNLVGGFDTVVQWAADILGEDWGGISVIQEVKFSRIAVPTYGDGGFPESGQAFIARENGIPEMVGTIGRRAAVANNEQIVESVASGVAEANTEQNSLLREQNSLLRALLEKDSGVYLDGRSLSTSVDKYRRERGREVIVGGVL